MIRTGDKRETSVREKDKAHLWHPFTQMREWTAGDPLVIERGEGNYLIDDEGRKYLDGVSSLWVTVHGHNHRKINAAITDQLGKIAHSTLLGLASPPSAELAAMLAAIAPTGLSKVFYSDCGSTAVEIGLKMAFQYWRHKGETGRTRFACLNHGYHGDTIGAVSVGGIDLFHDTFRPLLFDTIRIPAPYCYRCGFGADGDSNNCRNKCLAEAARLLQTYRSSIAALVMEPVVQGAAGMIVHPEGFLRGIADLCRENGILLILDEVATGFGRTGALFACEHEGVVPDILCVAKGITGGYLPLAATIASDRIYAAFLGEYDEFKTFFHGHTYTGNPLACAAAIANLRLFDEERTIEKVQTGAGLLAKALKRFDGHPCVGEVRQKGYMAGIELVRNRKTKELFPVKQKIGAVVSERCRRHGVITRPLGHVLVMMPPLSITPAEIELLCDAMHGSLCEVTGER